MPSSINFYQVYLIVFNSSFHNLLLHLHVENNQINLLFCFLFIIIEIFTFCLPFLVVQLQTYRVFAKSTLGCTLEITIVTARTSSTTTTFPSMTSLRLPRSCALSPWPMSSVVVSRRSSTPASPLDSLSTIRTLRICSKRFPTMTSRFLSTERERERPRVLFE